MKARFGIIKKPLLSTSRLNLYNDKSVLENHHLQVAYTLLKRADCNILSKLDQEEWEYFRHLVVEMVLATDMAEHFSQVWVYKLFWLLSDLQVK